VDLGLEDGKAKIKLFSAIAEFKRELKDSVEIPKIDLFRQRQYRKPDLHRLFLDYGRLLIRYIFED
jgi:hypothetical protein